MKYSPNPAIDPYRPILADISRSGTIYCDSKCYVALLPKEHRSIRDWISGTIIKLFIDHGLAYLRGEELTITQKGRDETERITGKLVVPEAYEEEDLPGLEFD